MTLLRLTEIRPGHPSRDGAGVKIRRLHDFQGGLDPLLMLDELRAAPDGSHLGGFPDHPHRGFETLTYLLDGRLLHGDHLGNRGEIAPGDAQWMRAGRGVIHSEMPQADAQGLHGFQLWINLPAEHRMDAPAYRDLRAGEMPRQPIPGGTLTAIAGAWELEDGHRLDGPLRELGHQDAALAHLHWTQAGQLAIRVPNACRALLHVHAGGIVDGPAAGELGLYEGEGLLRLDAEPGTGALLLIGRPLNEPIVHHGPFVMNTETQIQQAVADYQAGRLTD